MPALDSEQLHQGVDESLQDALLLAGLGGVELGPEVWIAEHLSHELGKVRGTRQPGLRAVRSDAQQCAGLTLQLLDLGPELRIGYESTNRGGVGCLVEKRLACRTRRLPHHDAVVARVVVGDAPTVVRVLIELLVRHHVRRGAPEPVGDSANDGSLLIVDGRD